MHQHSLPLPEDAFSLFQAFKNKPHAFFLDSSITGPEARFSYMGCCPFKTIASHELSRLKKIFDRHRLPMAQAPRLAFPAGAVGYLGYDGAIFFGLYDTVLAVDHKERRLIISSLSKKGIADVLKALEQRRVASSRRQAFKGVFDLKDNFSKQQYIQAIRKALGLIRQGDIYQINLSHKMWLSMPGWRKSVHPCDVYKNLRLIFPSEFGAYFDDGKRVMLSASPERFLRLYKGLAQIRPMKGTRPRGKTSLQDKFFKAQLLNSGKEIAELLMITDLERNDLGRVCDYNSVRVTSLRRIETYSEVFQATSTVQGRLRKDCDLFDLLQATFPGGSVTGTPKIAAMKIIKDLERTSRGLYTGALGYISFSGNMDFNVMIRTLFLDRDKISFHVGGGIVADSNPQAEWEETLLKAKPLIESLKKTFL